MSRKAQEQSCQGKGGGRAGFTLVEVSLAVLVLGLGILTVFSLFPSGLRSAEEGAADTHCALFSDAILSGIHANAASVTNWHDWCDGTYVAGELLNSLPVSVATNSSAVAVQYPAGGGWLRYQLTLDTADPDRYWATLRVWDGQFGSLAFPAVFYTEFIFSGM